MSKELAVPVIVLGGLMLVNQWGLQSLFQLFLPIILLVVGFKALKGPVQAGTGGGHPAPH